MFNITNYFDHPTRPGYTIFKFFDANRANYFEELLKKNNIWFEASKEKGEKTIYFFGVKKSDYKNAMNANYLVSANYRSKIIPNFYFRWLVIIFAIAIMLLAIVSAIKS
ncbi:MAG: hypothetical protein COX70_03115 [Flavobacteriales bacterium CG_4_10_14_0_2_um_filter_32_8]|nr:MAG: hypothetical protein COX70_03115 [Flavobacteriales bacterium CG_4_10_14_0_2_um_filter_32_8]PJB16600.1 MAG: hypothetical protein CO118_00180 [Flavobacteriales bacterium CG_4_9_14_3_um_filter_32_8]